MSAVPASVTLTGGTSDLQALYAIFDDKRHPFYEHKIAA